MQKQRQAKIVAIAGQSGEHNLIKIGFDFDAKNAEISVTNNSCLAGVKSKKISEYINKKWIDYVKTNFVKARREMFLQNSLSFLCEFNI